MSLSHLTSALAEKVIVFEFTEEEKKKIKSYNKNRQKTEAEIIQDALDVFGGIVLK